MSGWDWEYTPDRAQVTDGLPEHIVAAAERTAEDLKGLAEVGVDITDIGHGPDHGGPGGVRRIDLPTGGWVLVLPLPRLGLIEITRIVPPVEHL
ncbi:hypothetical protein [Streptomyces iconiensis]|uniref:Uncharacterized protein n=1 Tax=Streptomyces iconiensis TaxID=1384038 RepID=A0ABT7A2X4_9ACTN|nr:hypothetical protein [Streptomyces iconiensis]MDJ1135417.1 hypothetical protein [Streptomyces iconiensis]